MNILYLEDDPIDAEALRRKMRVLRPAWRLEIAVRPSNAIALLKTKTFDAVIIDINLPEMSGFEFLEHLKAAGLLPAQSIVFSSSEHRVDLKSAQDLAVSDYVVKRTDLTCFEELIAKIAPETV